MEHSLTYQWITPLMIGMIAFLVGVIGFMIKGYLASIDTRFKELNDKITKHIDRMELVLDDHEGKYFNLNSRVAVLEVKNGK